MAEPTDLPQNGTDVSVLAWAYRTTQDSEYEWARLEVTSNYRPWRRNVNDPDRVDAAIKAARQLLSDRRAAST